MKSIFLFLWFTFLSTIVYAMPVGMDPTQGYCQNVDSSACGWGGGTSRQPTKVINIPSHYGAIALDGKKLVIGSSENNLKGFRSAKKEALQNCKKLGGTECEIYATTRNGCLALALGSKGENGGVASAGGAEIKEAVEKKMLQRCKEQGGQKCFIAYSHCSRDPRHSLNKFN